MFNTKKLSIKKNGCHNKPFKLTLLICFCIIFLIALTINPPSTFKSEGVADYKSPLTTFETPNSKPLLVSHFATINNEQLSPNIPQNVSFTLVKGWTSKNTTIFYEGVSRRSDWVINGDFNSSLVPWENTTTTANMVIAGWDPSGYISVNLPGGPITEADYAYYYENISIPETLTAGKLISLSLDYMYQGGPNTPDMALAYMAVEIGGIEANYTLYFTELQKGPWTSLTFNYDPNSLGQELPNNLILKLGVKGNHSASVLNSHDLFIDNVELKIWTQPNQSNLIYAMDYETGLNYTYQNSSFGMGRSFIGVQKSYADTINVIFTIFNNMTSALDMEIYNITISSNVVKAYNTTIDGVPGSQYLTNGLIKWQTEWEVAIPSNYLNSRIEIEKPVDWNVTLILDGYDTDQTGLCSGIEFGSGKISISTAIVGNGLWLLEAESYNYINEGYISRWNGTGFENETSMYVGDKFQINAVLNNTLSLTNTQINCTIQYPNNTIYIQEIFEPSSYSITFGNYSVGLNMSIGNYQVTVEWINNLSAFGRDKVGFKELEFKVIHRTNLTAVEPYIEEVAGVPTLVKVKFDDFDLNNTIALAEATYNSTYGASGSMVYIGSGIYMAELDTAALSVGDYYLSFNISKSFYQNQSIGNLIHLKIRPEALVLEVSRQVKNVSANSYAYYTINITGEISGLFLFPANITLDWFRNYTISDFGDGTYGINVSTFEATSGTVPETYTITVSVNKTGYGSTTDILLLKVYPIPAQIGVNATLVQIPYGDQFYIRANYTVVATNQTISGAACNVTWATSYSISPVGDDFLIMFNTSGLSIDVHIVLIEISHLGFELELKSILVTITPIPTQIGVNTTFVSVPLGDSFYLRANYTVDGSGELISGSNCTVTWAGSYNITPIGNEFIISFNTSGLPADIHMILIQMNYPGYETALENIFVSLSPIPAEIGVNSTLVGVTLGDLFYIRVNYTEEATSDLIVGAICNVTWSASYTITPVGNEFIVAFNTTGLSPDIHTVLIQMSHPSYETKLKNIFATVSPIPAEIGANSTLLSVILGEIFYIRANYTVEGSTEMITGANCTVTWAAPYTVFPVGDEFIIMFNTTGLTIDIHTALIQISHPNYESAVESVLASISPIPAQIGVNITLVEVTLGDIFYIIANYTEESTSNIIAGASCNVTWSANYNVNPIGNDFLISFNTTGLSIDIYTILIQMEHPNYETEFKNIFVTIYPMPSEIGVNNTLVVIPLGYQFHIKVNYTEEGSSNLIAGANYTVTWDSNFSVTPVGNEFIITFNTTNLISDVYSVFIQMSHPNYEATLKTILVTITPIPSQIGVNISLLEVEYRDQFTIMVNYTEEATTNLIGNATCTVTWGSAYNITPVGDEFIVIFNTTGLFIDTYTALIQMEHPAYETALQVINVIVKPIESELLILNPAPIEFIKGDIVNLTCEYSAKGQPILNATLTLIGDITGDFLWNGSVYYFTINTSTLTAKSYFTQVMGSKANFKLQIKDNIFTILSLALEIRMNTTNIQYQEGIANNAYLTIYDSSHNVTRIDLKVTYSYQSQSGELTLQPNGSYLLFLNALNLPPSTIPHQIEIAVSNPHGDDVTLTLNIVVPTEEPDYSLIIWILVIAVVAISGVLLGVFIKNRYLNLTKFQRIIQKSKTQLVKKGKLEQIDEPKRDELLKKLLEEEFSMFKINNKQIRKEKM